MFHPLDYPTASEEDLQICFKGYCEWCWGNGFGDCDACRAALKKRLDEMEENRWKDWPNSAKT